jgi:hypothetical protein
MQIQVMLLHFIMYSIYSHDPGEFSDDYIPIGLVIRPEKAIIQSHLFKGLRAPCGA